MTEIIEGFMNPPQDLELTPEQKDAVLSILDIIKYGGTAVVKLQKGCIKVQEMSVKERFVGKEKIK